MSITLASGRRIPLAPPEGWLTLGLVLLLCMSLAWSLDDALLVLGRDEYLDFLTWTVVGGVVAGFIGPMVGWGRWRTYLVGATFAALLTPLLVGWVVEPLGGSPAFLFQTTTDEVVEAWSDLVLADRTSTSAVGHHLLILGLLVWGSSMFASYAAFGHRRPLNAVLLIGLLLIGNMAFTYRDQLVYLVVYSLAALFLLIRFHTFDEQADWIRRRIGDPTTLSGLYLRGGTIFIVVAVLGSLLLTNVASSAPLASVWTDMGGRVIEWSQFLQRYLPETSTGRSIGPGFGDSASIGRTWTTNSEVALTWEAPTTEQARPYIAAVVYSDFDGYDWSIGDSLELDRATDDDLLAETADATALDGRREMVLTITPALSRSIVYVAGVPARIGQPVTVQVTDDDRFLSRVTRSTSNAPYTVTVLVSDTEINGGVTENRLRVAGTEYPEAVIARYGPETVPDTVFTTAEARALVDAFAVAGANPYDIASAMVTAFHSNRFEYDTNISDLDCDDLSVVDCFAVYRRGFCEYYASTMAMILRELGIPARMVEGFLPGEKTLSSGVNTVRNSDAHAWVQVYFPGSGWIDFDPTGGSRAALAPLPSGRPEAAPSAGASTNAGRTRPPESIPIDREEPTGSGGITGGGRGPVGPLIVMTLLLAVIVGALALVAWRRGPRGPVTADGAYGMVTRLASRFGFGPRPNQTVYEYAGTLAEILPSARPELETVARAKVEVAYGGRHLGADRINSLREAQRRLRMSLLRLALRRDRRRTGRSLTRRG